MILEAEKCIFIFVYPLLRHYITTQGRSDHFLSQEFVQRKEKDISARVINFVANKRLNGNAPWTFFSLPVISFTLQLLIFHLQSEPDPSFKKKRPPINYSKQKEKWTINYIGLFRFFVPWLNIKQINVFFHTFFMPRDSWLPPLHSTTGKSQLP